MARTSRGRAFLRLEALEDRLVFAVTISVDAAVGLHAIDPRVYGMAYADAASLADLNVPFNRSGGNPTSRYNWQINADNRASDYFFESIGYNSNVPGEHGDSFISASRAGGAQPDLTIPTLDWVANLGTNRAKLASFSIAKYGTQQQHDQWFPDAGNGVLTNGKNVTGNDPNDANVPSDPAFQQGWVQHLVNTYGLASAGGLQYYSLDNEPSIWFSTHRDVHPVGPTMDEIYNKTVAYASMIKGVDPSALVLGPEEWGWSGYFYSGYDQQYGAQHNWSSFPDRAAHGNMDYLPWLLDQLHQNQVATGKRLLDVFTMHYYPQGGEFGNSVTKAMQLLRNQSTRSLWDPNYVDQSWINDKVDLLPRLKNWVNTYYPGTQVGLTEYNWGAENHMNGATTQADILGILGREGLDLAARWTTPNAGTPAYNAIKMYRDYDGHDSAFGDTNVSATVPNPDQVSAFAGLRSLDGDLTVMAINKNLYDPNNPGATTPITVNVGNFANKGVAHVWILKAPNPSDMTTSTISQLADVPVRGNSFTFSAPQQSVILFVLEPQAPGAVQFNATRIKAGEGAGTATVTVTRNGGSQGTVSIHYATSDGTAKAGTDYTAVSGTLVFQNGETSKTFLLPITDDSLDEANETIHLTLSQPTGGAALGTPATATLTILDNDAPPSISIGDVSKLEGNSGTTTFTFTVTLSAPSGQKVTVHYSTADGTATAGSDYVAASGTLTFSPGQTSKKITVTVNRDTTVEPDETFFVNLDSPLHATLADAQGVGTIRNDDSAAPLLVPGRRRKRIGS